VRCVQWYSEKKHVLVTGVGSAAVRRLVVGVWWRHRGNRCSDSAGHDCQRHQCVAVSPRC